MNNPCKNCQKDINERLSHLIKINNMLQCFCEDRRKYEKMNKYKIIALFGPAGSGKDYVQKQMMETEWGRKNLHEIIQCTTRPPREDEKDGIDYHFIATPEEFMNWENMGKWLEFSNFRGWWYGTSIDHLTKDKPNLGVFNIKGIKSLLEDEECEVYPIYIYTYDKLRLMRQLVREGNPDCYEICRRFMSDKEDFAYIPFSYKTIENNTYEIQPLLDDLTSMIQNWTNVYN